MTRFLFGEQREVVQSENVDTGGMFEWEVGVVKQNEKYRSFVKTAWGGGAMGPTKETQREASDDIERLMDRV